MGEIRQLLQPPIFDRGQHIFVVAQEISSYGKNSMTIIIEYGKLNPDEGKESMDCSLFYQKNL